MNSVESEVKAESETFQRRLLSEALEQCSPQQQAFFHRLYPDGPRPDQLINAIGLCRRTLAKNAKGHGEGVTK